MDRKSTLMEAFPALVILGMVEAVGGIFLSSSGAHAIPGMLAVVPALISLRGNISGSFASRLGSLAHLGVFDPAHPFSSSKEGIKAAITLSVSFSAFAAILASALTWMSGTVPDIYGVLTVTVLTSNVSSTILSSVAVLSVAFAFRHKIDPDNVVVPLLSTVGDLLSIMIMSAFIWLWVVFV
jgi:mgtE-like transporter